MAGEGSRFLKEGWSTPKPLIQLHGKPLFQRAIDSIYDTSLQYKHSFIVRQEHIEQYGIDKSIRDIFPEANIFTVQKTTRGAVETCLFAKPAISSDDALIVMDCDLEFRSKDLMKDIRFALSKPAEQACGGALVSFDSKNTRYSYAAIDAEGYVVRTAEKEAISSHALCGAYFFSSAGEFLDVASQMLGEPHFSKKEFYVSLLYNYLIAKGDKVKLAKMEMYHSYGTPEELQQYI